LSDEDFFDMGAYNLDKEQITNPNSKLHNLFGGGNNTPKRRRLSMDSKEVAG